MGSIGLPCYFPGLAESNVCQIHDQNKFNVTGLCSFNIAYLLKVTPSKQPVSQIMDFLALLWNESIYLRIFHLTSLYIWVLFLLVNIPTQSPHRIISEWLGITTKTTLGYHKANLFFLPSPWKPKGNVVWLELRNAGGESEKCLLPHEKGVTSWGRLIYKSWSDIQFNIYGLCML